MRLFFGIFPPEEIQEGLEAGVRDLLWGEPGFPEAAFRWVRPERRHLTLRFLGEQEADLLPGLEASLEELCRDRSSFPVRLTGFGAFPSTRKARVLWVGVGEGRQGLVGLAEELERGLSSLGIAPEGRALRPHLSLARSRGRPVRLDPLPPFDLPSFLLSEVRLLESRLHGPDAGYRVLAKASLA